jgi:hypothetical protein
MATMLWLSLLLGAGFAAAGGLVLLMVAAFEGDGPASRAERRRYERVRCHFRELNDPVSELYGGDISLGGACVRLTHPTLGRRLKVMALDAQGFAEATVIEGRVLSVSHDDGLYAHHLAFDPGETNITVAALVAAGAV